MTSDQARSGSPPGVAGGKGDPTSLQGNPANYFSGAAKSADADGGIAYLKDQK